MAFRYQPRVLYITALAIFILCAIAPVAYMLAQFGFGLATNPSSAASVLLDTRQLVLLGRSLAIALLATLIALAIGWPTAFILAAKDTPCRGLLYFFVLVPLLVPPYIMSGAWIHLLSPGSFINSTLASVFGPGTKLTVFSTAGCAWCLAVSFFPIIAIVVAAGLATVDRNLDDIARLSTGRWGTFYHSTLVQILPHLTASICLVMIFVLGRYGVPSLLGVNTYPVEIFARFSAFYDENAAVAISLPLMLLVVVLILIQRRFMRNRYYVSITPSSETGNPIRLRGLNPYAIGFVAILFVITTVLPFVSVIAYTESPAKIWSSLQSAGGSITTTTILAIFAALISTAVALPIGRYLATGKGRFAGMLDVLCWLPIAIPGTMIGLGIVRISGLVPAVRNADSFGILLLLAYIGMFSAFAIRILEASYRRADPNVAESAALDCPRWYQRLFYIDLPIHSPAIAASMIIVAVLVVGELNATVLLIPPGSETLAVTIDNLLHYGANVKASVLCLTEVVFVILALGVGLFIWKRSR